MRRALKARCSACRVWSDCGTAPTIEKFSFPEIPCQAQSWQPTSAAVLDTALKKTTGEDTMYRVSARYRYVVNGATYVGSRVGFSSGSDNIGEWQRDHYDQLHIAMIQNRPITIWFDPDNPE